MRDLTPSQTCDLPTPSIDLARAARRSEATPADWDDDATAKAVTRSPLMGCGKEVA